jgi:hypothetical protein
MIAGENLIARISPMSLDIADYTLVRVSVWNDQKKLATYTIGTDDEVREGNASDELEVEIVKALSRKLLPGDLILEITTEEEDAELEVDPGKKRVIFRVTIAEINDESATESEIAVDLSGLSAAQVLAAMENATEAQLAALWALLAPYNV